ncbi:cytochrome P450 [Nocardioides mangrovi]|uniref:Cytochrome P450 n=1 Tax=Nocardioides mangrovi TaxID=2874580 RepID=A0ABS7UED4_9ACTN|nr:cytochrome P450 [Nocardioides mangrovi]MBZ5739175.1 cytochrome P450 [Nocardioides mangrovi]
MDPTDPEVNERGLPHDYFRELRATSPVHWVEQPASARRGMAPESGTGYWALTRHEDVAAVSRSRDFSTYENTAIIRSNAEDVTRESLEATRVMLINQDEPHHGEMRRIVARGFTARNVKGLHDITTERAHALVDEALASGSGDFVDQIAAELPLMVIADLLGIPQEDRRKVFDWSNTMLASDDPDFPGDPSQAAAQLVLYAMELAADRKLHPRADLITTLLQASDEGRGLNDDEFGYFVILLAVAGNETTRNAITHGMNAFLDHPDQWALWHAERPATMVDEVIRWATPVTVFQRTALRDVVVGGTPIPAGQRLALFYASANFDESVFRDPFTFDVTRDPNPHLAFGGHGAHYCLGANLARQEVAIMFDVLADRVPDISKLAEPRRLRHSWIHGVKELQVSYGTAG